MPPKSKAAASKASASALTKFEEKFAKSFGVGTLTRSAVINPYEVISTGSLALDYALGVGGFVEGRLHEIWGPEGIGKTRVALLTIVQAQRKHPDKMAAFIDVEQKMDAKWAAAHGVDLERLFLYRPNTAEDVADAVKEFVASGLVSLVVIDSIGAMIPEREKEKDAGDAVVGKQAQIVTRMVKIAAAEAPKTSTTVVIINQQRANLAYGADTTTGGGFALKHATTTKLKVKRSGAKTPIKVTINGEERTIGHEIAITVERNGVANAYRTATITMFHVETEKYGPIGIDIADETVTLGLKTRVIKQRGAWYDLPDSSTHQGREALLQAVRENLTVQEQIRDLVLQTMAGTIKPEESPEDIEEQSEEDPMAALRARVEKGEGPAFRTSGSIAEDA